MSTTDKAHRAGKQNVQASRSTKAKDALRYTGNFAWVNKDSTNLTQASKEEIATVRSHIQGRFVPWNKQNRIKSTLPNHLQTKNIEPRSNTTSSPPRLLRRTKTPPSDQLYPECGFGEIQCETLNSTSPRKLAKFLPVVVPPPPTETSPYIEVSTEDQECLSEQVDNVIKSIFEFDPADPDPSASSIWGSGSDDPLNKSSKLDAHRQEYLHLLGIRIMTVIWPSLRTSALTVEAEAAWNLESHNIVHDETYLHGLIASAFCLKSKLAAADPIASKRFRVKSYIHQAECLKQIRKSLSERAPDQRIVLAIWALVSVYMLDGDIQTCRIHLTNLKLMLDQIGGLPIFPELIQRKILLWDVAAAGPLLLPPLFRPADWSPSSSEILCANIGNPTIRQCIKTIVSNQKFLLLHETVPEILREHFNLRREAISVRSYADRLDKTQDAASIIDEWHYRWLGSLEAANLELYNEIRTNLRNSGDRTAMKPKIDLGLCLSLSSRYLHRFIARQNSETSGCMPYGVLKRHLQDLVQVQPEVTEGQSRYTMLWMYFVGAAAEDVRNRDARPEDAKLWFTANFLSTATRLGLTTLFDVQNVLFQFIYDAGHFDETLQSILSRLDGNHNEYDLSDSTLLFDQSQIFDESMFLGDNVNPGFK